MSDILTRLEILPNEILIDVFQYLDGQDLFRAFYNLNTRFNVLLHSLDDLSLTVRKLGNNNSYNFEPFSSSVCNLIINSRIIIDLSYFPNIRYLTLQCVAADHIKQLEADILPNLEHLSIGYQYFRYSQDISDLSKKIFSNGFPCLKSCYLSEPRIIKVIPWLTQSMELSTLKVEIIDIFIYKNILWKCLNLKFFQFTIVELYENFITIDPHLNLKQMIIKFEELDSVLDDDDVNPYLCCVPNLERLSIHQSHSEIDMTIYLKYDWLVTTIDSYLSMLNRFKFTIHLSQTSVLMGNGNIHNTLRCMKEEFQEVHNQRYQPTLVCSLSKIRFSD